MTTKLYDLRQGVAVPDAAGLTFDPALKEPVGGVDTLVAPDIVIPVPKATAAGAAVTTAMATGNLTVVHGAGAPVAFDILTIRLHTIQRVLTALLGAQNDRRRYFVIADSGPDAAKGAVYADRTDTSRQFRVDIAKVSGDGSTLLRTTQIAGATAPGASGDLDLVSGTGDATFAWTQLRFEKYSAVLNGTAIADGAGTAINPLLARSNALAAPNIVIPITKALPVAVTNGPFVATAMGTGPITVQHAEAAPVSMDILSVQWHTLQLLTAALLGAQNDRRRLFTISDSGPDAAKGAIYEDRVDTTRTYRVDVAKISGDGSTTLHCTQISGAAVSGATGDLDLVSGTGDASIAWTALKFEKYVDIKNAVSVPAGAGLTFDPGLVVDGVAVMPDIVIPVAKATGTVPFVATDLTGAVGTVNVSHNNVGAIAHDILSLKAHSIFRDVG